MGFLTNHAEVGNIGLKQLREQREITTQRWGTIGLLEGLDGNIKVAKVGGNVAKVARDELESNLGESIVTLSNRLNYEYDKKEMITQK